MPEQQPGPANGQQLTVTNVPLGQLRPAPWNPRTIRDHRFKTLCQSIEADPGFLLLRPVLAQLDGTIYAGNMRYRAAEHLGHETVPAVLADIPVKLAKERALRDNRQWGEWVDGDLGTLLQELLDEGAALDLLGFDEVEVDRLLAGEFDPAADWQGMPEYGSSDLTAKHHLIVNFVDEADLLAFGQLVGAPLTTKTKSIWWPVVGRIPIAAVQGSDSAA